MTSRRRRKATPNFVLLSRRTVRWIAVAATAFLMAQLVLLGLSYTRLNQHPPVGGASPTAVVEIVFMFTAIVLVIGVVLVPIGYARAQRIYQKIEAMVRDPNLRFSEVRRLGSFGRVIDRIMDRQEFRFNLLRGYTEVQQELIRNLVARYSSPIMVADAQQRVFSINEPMRRAIDEDRSSIRLDQLEMDPPYGELARQIVDDGGTAQVVLKEKKFHANGILGWFPEREEYDAVWHGLQYIVIGTESFGGFGPEARRRLRTPESTAVEKSRGWRRLFQGWAGRR